MSINPRAFFIVGLACAWFAACGDSGAPSGKGGAGRGGSGAGAAGKGGSGGEAGSSGESGKGGSTGNTGGSSGKGGSSGRGGTAGRGGSAGRTGVAGDSGETGLGGEAGTAGSSGGTAGSSGGEGGGENGPGCTALRFSAMADTVEIPDDASLTFGPQGTIEAWIFRTEAASGGFIFTKWVDFQEDKVVFLSGNVIHAYTVPVLPSIVTSNQIALTKWTHVAFVYGQSTRTIFVDGVVGATSNVGGNPSNSDGPIHIGGIFRDGTWSEPLRGFIADVRVSDNERYSATFTPEKQLASDANTMGLWKLDEGSGTTVADGSGNDNTGTISGATWAPVDCR
jgi:hypothetical protein